jgi:hypothetical protein
MITYVDKKYVPDPLISGALIKNMIVYLDLTITSDSSSQDGFLFFRSSRRKYMTFSVNKKTNIIVKPTLFLTAS